MPRSIRSSSASAICRLEWRPSRWVSGALVLLSLLTVPALFASDLPSAAAWLSAIAAFTSGWRSLTRELRRPACEIVLAADGQATIDGRPAQDFAIAWRGPLAFVRWLDAEGHVQRRSFWPDTLPSRQRRELRLAARERTITPETGGMAH